MGILLTVVGVLVVYFAAELAFDRMTRNRAAGNWRCRLGWHKWFTLQSKSRTDIEHETQQALEAGKYTDGVFVRLWFNDRVCLRCDRRDDQVAAYADKYRAAVLHRQKLEARYLGKPRSQRWPVTPPPPPPKKRETPSAGGWG